jgi:hypothetical protein
VTEQQEGARDRGDAVDGVRAARADPAIEVVRALGWAAAYAVAVWLGHLTLVDATRYTLYWPASGVALVWLFSYTHLTLPTKLEV